MRVGCVSPRLLLYARAVAPIQSQEEEKTTCKKVISLRPASGSSLHSPPFSLPAPQPPYWLDVRWDTSPGRYNSDGEGGLMAWPTLWVSGDTPSILAGVRGKVRVYGPEGVLFLGVFPL